MWTTVFLLLLAVFSSQAWAQIGRGMVIFADAVYHNGKVLTVDERFSIVQAFAVREGKIMAAGTNGEILDLAGPNTRRLDLKGKTVIPGLIDTHSHLFDYAPRNWRKDLEALEPKMVEYRRLKLKAKSVEDAVSKLKEIVAKSQPGRVLRARLRPLSVADEFSRKIGLKEMDEIAPKNPLIVRLRRTERKASSLVYQMFKDHFGQIPPGLLDAQGRPTGQIGSGDLRSFVADILVRKAKSLAVIYKKELQAWAAYGVTTWSSSVPTIRGLDAFALMDKRGDMPIRFAYGHRMGAAAFAFAPDFYRRLGNLTGHGTDYLWFNGVAGQSMDSSYPRHCSSLKAEEKVKSREKCRKLDGPQLQMLYAAVKAGHRSTNTHVYGDGAVDYYFDVIEKASKDADMTLEDIRAKRHVIDHCGMSPRPDQIERAKKLNITWSCAPKYIEDAADISRDYGEKYAHEWNVPIQNILRAGGKVVLEMDDRRIHRKKGGAFAHIKYIVTRKDSAGRIWGPKQAVNKETALKLFTRWAAAYVLREKELGSLEPGKWADFAILDQDYLAVPNDDIFKINVLMTVVGGKPVYTEPDFAKAEGLEVVGLKWRRRR